MDEGNARGLRKAPTSPFEAHVKRFTKRPDIHNSLTNGAFPVPDGKERRLATELPLRL